MCDACRNLAFLELGDLTERQMEAARTILCPNPDETEDAISDAISDERELANQQYTTVVRKRQQIIKELTAARDLLGPHLVDCEELIEAVHGMVAKALRLVGELPTELGAA